MISSGDRDSKNVFRVHPTIPPSALSPAPPISNEKKSIVMDIDYYWVRLDCFQIGLDDLLNVGRIIKVIP